MLNTHMPFIAEHDEKQIWLCCRKVNGVWKIHYKNLWGEWQQLATGREDDATECAPTAEWIDGEWQISFIALGAKGNRLARLYKMVGNTVIEVASPAAVGFVRSDLIAYSAQMNSFVLDYGNNKKQIIQCEGMDELLRVSYDPSARHNLLISCRYFGRLSSWVYNLYTRKLFDVEADGEPAYKCAFFKEKCYYAKQVGDGFEDREVVGTENFKITPMPEEILTYNWDFCV